MNMPHWDIEREMTAQGYFPVCGVDEAGRGPLAGPVVAAAVILPAGLVIEGLNDSKKLSAKRRQIVYDIIVREAVGWAVCEASVAEIAVLNILGASQLAMRRAVSGLVPAPGLALVDGNIARDFPVATHCVVGGDAKSVSIAAASILAKVTRDRLMCELAARYPDYEFERHKGYPTRLHYEKLRTHGPCPIHRLHFLRSMAKAAP